MTKKKIILLNILVFLGAAGYIVATSLLWFEKSDGAKCAKVDIRIAGTSPYEFVTDSAIRQWIANDTVATVGVRVKDLNIAKIETQLRKQLYVDSVQVYSTMDGVLWVNVSQSEPLLRILSENGYDFYVDSTFKVLPMQSHCRAAVPVISGYPVFSFKPDYYGQLDDKKHRLDREYLKKITNFVECVRSDNFLRDFIVQIYINKSGEIELVPRLGDQIILFGELENHTEKLEKMKKFYLASFSQEWWATAKKVNLKFKDQVIVS